MFADVIVDISHESVDRAFEYIIPDELLDKIAPGSQVNIPFGMSDKLRKGFVINIKDTAAFDVNRLKRIDSVVEKSISLESVQIELAAFIRKNYGGTMSQALKTVLPVKVASKPVTARYIELACSVEEAEAAIGKIAGIPRFAPRERLIRELISEKRLPANVVRDRLGVSDSVVKTLVKDNVARVLEESFLRKAPGVGGAKGYSIVLNEQQQATADDIWERRIAKDTRPSLIRGVTGSGKTEIYIDLIARTLARGEQAIVLIPEIALTYQTVMRFYRKFGDRISVINSRLTPAEKHDQLEKARKGDVDIIIGPRSALFSPFKKLGIIIIDEEHESTYRNEGVPRYDAREVAIKRAQLSGGIVVLGSATPSMESYNKAEQGEYQLYSLEQRAAGARMAQVEIVDLREELKSGNRSMVSRRLQELIDDRLARKEQVMLFINRRGYSSFVSCRSCGTAIMCPHCDVSLKYHNNGRLVCHYCGYEVPMLKTCPSCGSKYIGTFGSGTQKVEDEIKKLFPQAGVLRMDLDTTREKGGHEKILTAFANHEADILVGTQMIVKGHDFANVTLVGIMAADLSLYSSSYQAPEKTFQLLTQAAGRAGRGGKAGNVVVQTYSPDNYAVKLGAEQDFKGFYEYEMRYRKLLGYPPAMNMLGIHFSSPRVAALNEACSRVSLLLDASINDGETVKIGPTDAPVAKINDRYRKIIYLKSPSYAELTRLKDAVEAAEHEAQPGDVLITFDFSSISK